MTDNVVHVIDDDHAARDALAFLLKTDNFSIHAYESAKAFLSALPDAEAGCIITDVRMPEMSGSIFLPGLNGLELVAQLRNRDILIPAILITPAPSENLRNRAAAAGVPVVEKPLLGSRLLDSIRGAFDGHTKYLS
jgi:two-component system response regulator FixJ